MSTTEKTIDAQLAALTEKRSKVHRQVVEARLKDNPRFVAMVHAFKIVNRFDKEATNLLSADKYEASRKALQNKLDALEEKRAVAKAASEDLAELRGRHLTAQEELTAGLVSILNDGEIPENFDARINEMLDSIGADALTTEPSDPFTAYRRNKSQD